MPPDPRHAAVKALLGIYWAKENPETPDLPWSAAEAGCVGSFLRANPRLHVDIIQRCLDNRLISEDHPPAERIHRWFGDVLRYSQTPLDRFRLPKVARSAEATLGRSTLPNLTSEQREVTYLDLLEKAKRRHADGKPLLPWQSTMLREEGLL
jgi:hypothetical protein